MIRGVLGSRASIGGVLGSGRGGAAGLPVAGALLWLDASQIIGASDGSAISTWPDMSGNNRHATQSNADHRPVYKTSILNGNPVVRFDGGNDEMVIPEIAAKSFFIVSRRTSGVSGARMLSVRTISRNWFFGAETTGRFYAATGRGVFYANATTENWNILSGIMGASDQRLYANGTAGTANAVGNEIMYISMIGSYDISLWYAGDIAEMIAYDTALDDASRRAVEAYLEAKYAITLT